MLRSFINSCAYFAAFLGVVSFLGVLAFHFPEYLTTPRLRHLYTEAQMRLLLSIALSAAIVFGLFGLFNGQKKRVALLGLATAILGWLAGGPNVPIDGPIRTASFYISLDWVLLDLTLIGILFISIEKIYRLRPEQRALRRGWQIDLKHYVANHIFNGAMIFVISFPAESLRQATQLDQLLVGVTNLPIIAQVILIMLVTDLTQYWVHRASHAFPILWRFHQVHHSVESMDWLAGSRLHFVDVLLTRSLSLIPMTLLGFSAEAINIYLPILALQSVFIHCNVNYPIGFLRKLIATPQFHHWHHTGDIEHRDRNFSVTFPIFDLLFATYYCPKNEWPEQYGLDDSPFDETYRSHLLVPFGFRTRT